MMKQNFAGTEGRIERIKVLVMGPQDAGKTAILRQAIYGFEADQLRNLQPTVLVETHPEKKKSKYICQFFDFGGQEKFFEDYHRPENEKSIFNKANIFIFVVDSEKEELFPFARKEFWRALTKLAKYSSNALSVIFAHKQDLPEALSPEEVMELLLLPPPEINSTKLNSDPRSFKKIEKIAKRTVCYGTSIEEPLTEGGKGGNNWIKADEAIESTLQLYSKIMQKRSKTTHKPETKKGSSEQLIRKILMKLDQNIGARGSMLIDKSSGLSVASTLDKDDITQSMMGIIILNSAKVLRDLGEKVLNLVIVRGEENNVLLVNITEDLSLLVVLPLEIEVQLGYAIYMISETANRIKENLQASA
jgi:signal recognition particle receptor subunit beta/predicted regulator of Ras-like GTPase activity (Roadblock/LC7/MglB family)